MLLKAFDRYITEFMYAEVYFSSVGKRPVCRFNRFRSRRQYLCFCTRAFHAICEELDKTGLSPPHLRYMAMKLQEVGKQFVFEGEELVSRHNLLVFLNEKIVPPEVLDISSRRLLRAYLEVQYSLWQELCRLYESFSAVFRGDYRWGGKEIELFELGDALWTSGYILPLTEKKTKKLYFRNLFGFFNLSVPADPCRRLGELSVRSRPVHFLSLLQEKYLSYWEEREK